MSMRKTAASVRAYRSEARRTAANLLRVANIVQGPPPAPSSGLAAPAPRTSPRQSPYYLVQHNGGGPIVTRPADQGLWPALYALPRRQRKKVRKAANRIDNANARFDAMLKGAGRPTMRCLRCGRSFAVDAHADGAVCCSDCDPATAAGPVRQAAARRRQELFGRPAAHPFHRLRRLAAAA